MLEQPDHGEQRGGHVAQLVQQGELLFLVPMQFLRQRFDAVVQRVVADAQVGPVAKELEEADEAALRVDVPDDDTTRPEDGPVLAHVPPVVFRASDGTCQRQLVLRQEIFTVLADEQAPRRRTDDLLGRVAEQALRSPQPRPDRPVGVEVDDRQLLGVPEDRVDPVGRQIRGAWRGVHGQGWMEISPVSMTLSKSIACRARGVSRCNLSQVRLLRRSLGGQAGAQFSLVFESADAGGSGSATELIDEARVVLSTLPARAQEA